MKRWLDQQLEGLRNSLEPVRIVLDPDGLLDPRALEDGSEVAVAVDWYQLRRSYEQRGRHRAAPDPPLVIIIRSAAFVRAEDLPFDIEQAVSVARIRVPAPAELRSLVMELPDELSDRAVQVLSRQPPDALDELLEQLWGVAFPDPYDEALELQIVARLAADPALPQHLWNLIRPRLRGQLALALARVPPDAEPLQRAWQDWLEHGRESSRDSILRVVAVDLLPLFHAGVLKPERKTATGLPDWTRLGEVESGPLERAEELLAQRPSPWPPDDPARWLAAAAWWGQLRAAMAEGGTEMDEMRARGWATWNELDVSFGPWLLENFGRLLTSAANPPRSVHQVAGFLARRLRAGFAAKVMLVVLDGMGFAQWSMLARSSGLKVVEASASFAMNRRSPRSRARRSSRGDSPPRSPRR